MICVRIVCVLLLSSRLWRHRAHQRRKLGSGIEGLFQVEGSVVLWLFVRRRRVPHEDGSEEVCENREQDDSCRDLRSPVHVPVTVSVSMHVPCNTTQRQCGRKPDFLYTREGKHKA